MDRQLTKNEKAVQTGIENGVITRDPNGVNPIEIPPVPRGVSPQDWVYWQCYREVQQWMLDNHKHSAWAACKELGWSYNTWRTASKNPFALGMWAEITKEAYSAFATYLRENLVAVGHAMVQRATDTSDPQGVQAARLVLQELQRYQEEMEAQSGSEGPAISSSALLGMAKKARVTIERKRGGVTEKIEVDVEHDDAVE